MELLYLCIGVGISAAFAIYLIRQQRKAFDETIARVTAQLQAATADMMQQRQKELAETSTRDFSKLVEPLRETMDKMERAMVDNTRTQTNMTAEMRANMENLIRQSMAAKESTEELTRVFRHGSKVQGDWGETVLNELLHAHGLTEGIHYDTQSAIRDAAGHTVRTDSGSTLRPDVIIHLDQRRELIIDSKVSLSAFIDYVNADAEIERQKYLHAHVESLKSHVRELSAKSYANYIQPPKVRMDYVIMFVPHAGALWTALNTQPDLWRRAMDKNVFIADEQTLFAALRIVSLTWTQIRQAQNHELVFSLANEMLDRVGQFVKHYEAVGKQITALQKSYDDAQKKLNPNGQSIIQTAGKLIKLGAKQSDRNPIPQLMDIDEIPGLTAEKLDAE